MKIYVVTKEWWVEGMDQTWSRIVSAHSNPPDLKKLYGYDRYSDDDDSNENYYVTEVELEY